MKRVEHYTLPPGSVVLALLIMASVVAPAQAFPPYRSTDADTADPHSIEVRAGVQTAFDDGDTETLFPSLRVNLGLPGKLEIPTEFDFAPDGAGFDDGAAGLKWIPFVSENLSVGFESLVLLPIRPGDRNAGTETQIVSTINLANAQLHLNAGGVYDARAALTEKGWRASGLLEIPMGKSLVGLEFFAKDTNAGATDARVGAGIIYDMGSFDIRFAAHAGLTDAAPDATVNVWVSRTFSLF